MTTRNTTPSSSGHQPTRHEAASCRFLVRWFRSALIEISGATKKGRAHPRFDEIARHDAECRQQWVGYSIEMVREQLRAAAEEGPDALAETLRRVERAGSEWVRACTTGFREADGAVAVPVASIEFTKEAGEAMVAVQTYRETGSEADAERARRELTDVVRVSETVIDMASRRRSAIQRVK